MPVTVTKTVKSSGGDYSSLAAWEAGEQGDLVSADEIRQAECYSFADTTVFVIDGSTTDATRYLRIFTPTAERHNGTWNTGKYRIDPGTGSGNRFILTINDNHVRIEGIQIQQSKDYSFPAFCIGTGFNSLAAGADIRISHSVFKGLGSGGDVNNWRCIWAEEQAVGVTHTFKVWNSIAYDFLEQGGYGSTGAIAFFSGDDNVTFYSFNNTAQNCSTGFLGGTGTFVVKNCIAQDCTDGYNGTIDAASTDNCSDIASDAPGSNPETGEVTFVNEAADNFLLDSTDTVAKDKGADLSADANLAFSDDIIGTVRSGSWDIGASEVVAAGGDVHSGRGVGRGIGRGIMR